MLPPHELKNKEFTRAIRGYTTTEVDEHIGFMIEKYTELYKENDELERKLRTALAQLDTYKSEEESIRSALINAQKAGAGIINEANEKADVIVRSAKNNCDKILAELREKVVKEQETLETLKRSVADFKDQLFTEYQKHIDLIEQIAPEAELQPEDGDYRQDIIDGIKEDIAAATEEGIFIPAPEAEVPAESADGEIPEPLPAEEEPAETVEQEEAAGEEEIDEGMDPEEESEPEEEPSEPITDLSVFDEAGQIAEDEAKTLVIERSPASGRERTAGVRDTIRALNRKFNEEKEKSSVPADDADDTDDTDREFLKMIQDATSSAQKRQEMKQKNSQNDNDSETSEFERVYGKNR